MNMTKLYQRRVTLIDGQLWHYLDRDGCWYFVDHQPNGSKCLLAVPAQFDTLNPITECGELDVYEVTNLDEDETLLDDINNLLGTKFTMSHFPGR